MDPGAPALALVAGAVAAVNPCGFALLPAWLGLVAAGSGADRRGALPGALRAAAAMTAGFALLFGLVGLLLAPLVSSAGRWLPVVTVVTGVLLVGLGAGLLAGGRLALPGLAGRGRPPGRSWRSQLGFGVWFALASLSCTLAPFLAVTAAALRAGGPPAVVATYLAYALGMGAVVLALAVAVALARTAAVRALRRAGALAPRASGALLLLAGGWVAWYGWSELRVLAGGAAAADPVVATALDVQQALARAVAAWGPAGVLVLGLAAAAGTVLAAAVRRRRAARAGGRTREGIR